MPCDRKDVAEREVHLPEGEWIGFWDGQEYAGGTDFTSEAPLGALPVYYRKGSEFTEVFKKAGEVAAKKANTGVFNWF